MLIASSSAARPFDVCGSEGRSGCRAKAFWTGLDVDMVDVGKELAFVDAALFQESSRAGTDEQTRGARSYLLYATRHQILVTTRQRGSLVPGLLREEHHDAPLCPVSQGRGGP